MSTKRQRRSRIRQTVRAYAFAYLGVKKLPVGVPAILRDYTAEIPDNPVGGIPVHGLDSLLRPYRKPYWCL